MKIVGRGGHSLDVRGARKYVDEVDTNRIITPLVFNFLRKAGDSVLDVTPTYSGTSGVDLSTAVNKANAWGAEFFFSVHLNASDGMGHGCEVLYASDAGKVYAERICQRLSALGFYNRGAKKDVRGLYEFKACKCPNVIIECFFVDNAGDVALYNKVGAVAIAKAIAEGIVGHDIEDSDGWRSINGIWYYFENGSSVKNTWRQDSSMRWFYLGADGAMIKNAWAQDSHGWCYCGADGAWDGVHHANKG